MPDLAKAATAVGRAAQGLAALVGHRPDPVQQTLTIAAPPAEVAAACRDAASLSQALGDAGSVEAGAGPAYRWSLGADGGEAVVWQTALTETGGPPLVLRWAAPGGDDGYVLSVTLREAPAGLGTEATARAVLPVPGLAAGAALYTLLYRLRALVQTGEVPTITPQPAGRPGDR